MKKLFVSLLVCFALVGCKEKGGECVGEWKRDSDGKEVITVTKVDKGYRVVSALAGTGDYMNMEVVMVSETDNRIVSTDASDVYLDLSDSGSVTSHMRNKAQTFTRVN